MEPFVFLFVFFFKHIVHWLDFILSVQVAQIFLDAAFEICGIQIGMLLATEIMFDNELLINIVSFVLIGKAVFVIDARQLRVVLVPVGCHALLGVLDEVLIVISFRPTFFFAVLTATVDPVINALMYFPLKLCEILNFFPPILLHHFFRDAHVQLARFLLLFILESDPACNAACLLRAAKF
jgi:hypothetical protein